MNLNSQNMKVQKKRNKRMEYTILKRWTFCAQMPHMHSHAPSTLHSGPPDQLPSIEQRSCTRSWTQWSTLLRSTQAFVFPDVNTSPNDLPCQGGHAEGIWDGTAWYYFPFFRVRAAGAMLDLVDSSFFPMTLLSAHASSIQTSQENATCPWWCTSETHATHPPQKV